MPDIDQSALGDTLGDALGNEPADKVIGGISGEVLESLDRDAIRRRRDR